MALKATVSRFVTAGGAVEIEDIHSGDAVTLVERRSPMTPNALRRLGVQKLRALADRLEREIYRTKK